MADDEAEQTLQRPSLTFESITFSDGDTLDLNEDDIVVFVGPNNAGKSAALRELEMFLRRGETGSVIHSAKIRRTGDVTGFLNWLEKNSLLSAGAYRGMGYDIHPNNAQYFTSPVTREPVADFFASIVGTEERLSGSDPAGPIRLHFEPATHPIHLLLADENLAHQVSVQFSRAFRQQLIVFRAGGSSFPLLVGSKPALASGHDEFSKPFIEALLKQTVPLKTQGDGMRSFATILLHVLVAGNYSVQFLDEPEAFLHPPQARLLGELIAKERQSKAQLFVATHSPEVLEGLLAVESSKVRIVRMERVEDVNYIMELGRTETAAIANDPLTRYSGVLSGIFHQRVIISESETDCLFYNAVLHIPSVRGTLHPDVLFIHSGGKARMQKLAKLLKALDVPVSVISDIDILNDEATFRSLFEALYGNWDEVEKDWRSLNATVLQARPPLNADQVRVKIEHELGGISGNQPFPKQNERNISAIFKSLSSWGQIKKVGKAGFERGAPTRTFEKLYDKCGEVGLWIVPVGEVEGFCRSIDARHGPDFTEKVLTERDLDRDPELEDARAFVRQVWGKGHESI
jgi:ABC-type transport system involved in cytochrome c biogenesis ATPase subunit